MLLKHFFLLLFAAMLTPAFAREAAPAAADPVAEARLVQLAEELRCLVCQNQTIADSNAPLAVDLRNEIREKIQAGMSDTEIKHFMVARYGDFVLYRPPVKNTTLVLWIGPFLLLIVAAGILVFNLKRQRQRAIEPELSHSEQALATSLLQPGSAKSDSTKPDSIKPDATKETP